MNRLRYVLLAAVSVVCTAVMGQGKSITERIYWFDGDYASSASLGASVDISSLAVGMHSFTIWVKDSEGVWSSPVTRFFVVSAMPDVASEVAERECWLDGNIAGRTTLGPSEAIVDLGELGQGMHSFSMRVKDDVGVWSAPVTKFFLIETMPDVASEVSARECWLDGNIAGRTTLGPSEAIVDLGELGKGLHSFTMRVKDDVGVWSAPVTKFFLIETMPEVASEVAEREYWLDGDFAGRSTLGASEAIIDLGEQLPGMHSFTMRVRDDVNVWSAPVTKYFIIDNVTEEATEVAEREYWLDGDFANRTPLGTSEAVIDLGELGKGMHSFTMRLKNDVGVWSSPVTKYFFIAPIDETQAVTLTQYAYWFDDDITRVQNGPLEAASGIIPVSIKHLDEGRHALKWTVGDSHGHWSAAAVDSFDVVHLPLTEMKFDLAERTFEYSAEDIEPEPTIIDGDETLVRDEDYEILYADNRNAGTATMNVRGLGFYKDSIQTDFTITKAPLTVKADDKVKEQGEENPELTFTIEGWKGNDDESVLGALPVATTTATADSPAGMYDILINGGEALNYTFIYVSGVLTIEEQVGIDDVSDDSADDEWYTLAGQKLDRKPTKAGIYIHNGRKVLVK